MGAPRMAHGAAWRGLLSRLLQDGRGARFFDLFERHAGHTRKKAAPIAAVVFVPVHWM